MTRSERGQAGILERLLTEDPQEMTAAALASDKHVSKIEGWARKAQEINPKLTDKQAERVGEMMRTQHFKRMGRLSAQARKLAKQAQAELGRAPEEGAA